jgi:hypothetical protein
MALRTTVVQFKRHIQMLRPALDLLLHQVAADPNTSMLRYVDRLDSQNAMPNVTM